MFKFNSITSDQMQVIVEEELNFIRKASVRTESIEIESKDGIEYSELGFGNVEIPIVLQLLNKSKLDDVLSWLNGSGILEYNGRICKAYVYSESVPTRFGSIYKIDVTFIREPFWHINNDFTECTNSIENKGNITAKPQIKLIKNTTEDIEITINDVRFSYHFNGDEEVIIDCVTYNAFLDGVLKNNNLEISFEYPTLKPGINNLIIHSGDPTIMIKDKDWYL